MKIYNTEFEAISGFFCLYLNYIRIFEILELTKTFWNEIEVKIIRLNLHINT